ncbi:hypothetical protein H5410_004902 [Solanum commersonii]|uniref:Uncharacterized protein n=1 Tax=Solanum commersonii TaxID=4109 RepID=A0A9J6A650_SOLCO|nr:hypothetical protein H5410_004902 [Solanum commersonii]
MELLRQGANNDIFKLQRNKTGRYGGNKTRDTNIQTTTVQNATEKTISFQLSTWNRKYLQDSKKTKAKIMEDKA